MPEQEPSQIIDSMKTATDAVLDSEEEIKNFDTLLNKLDIKVNMVGDIEEQKLQLLVQTLANAYEQLKKIGSGIITLESFKLSIEAKELITKIELLYSDIAGHYTLGIKSFDAVATQEHILKNKRYTELKQGVTPNLINLLNQGDRAFQRIRYLNNIEQTFCIKALLISEGIYQLTTEHIADMHALGIREEVIQKIKGELQNKKNYKEIIKNESDTGKKYILIQQLIENNNITIRDLLEGSDEITNNMSEFFWNRTRGLYKDQIYSCMLWSIKKQITTSASQYSNNLCNRTTLNILHRLGVEKIQLYNLIREDVRRNSSDDFLFNIIDRNCKLNPTIQSLGFTMDDVQGLLYAYAASAKNNISIDNISKISTIMKDETQLIYLIQNIKIDNNRGSYNNINNIKSKFKVIEKEVPSLSTTIIAKKNSLYKNILQELGLNENSIADNNVIQYCESQLGNKKLGYESQQGYFIPPNEFQKITHYLFVEQSKKTSNNFNNSFENHHNREGNSIEQSIPLIKKDLEAYSSEAIISALGNQAINLNTTTDIMLEILFTRHTNIDGIFQYLSSKRSILNEKTIHFLEGQIIIGVLGKGKHEYMKQFMQAGNKEKIFSLIKDVILYKQSDSIFSQASYLGLMIGLKESLNHFPELGSYIYRECIVKKPCPNEGFKKSIQIALYLDGNYLGATGVTKRAKGQKASPEMQKYLENNSFSIDILSMSKKKDICMIYGGAGTGGGLERMSDEERQFITLGYTVSQSNEWIKVLEKDGVRVFLINYDAYPNEKKESMLQDMNTFLKSKEGDRHIPIYPLMLTFRGHNSTCSAMIESTCKDGKGFAKTKGIIVDGGCNNINQLSQYRNIGIQNPIIAYDNTGKGNPTFGFVTSFITRIVRDKELQKQPTGTKLGRESVFDTMLGPKGKPIDNSSNLGYAREHFIPPGSFIDLIISIEGIDPEYDSDDEG